MKFVLTGASGLLGSAVHEEANKLGWECVALSHQQIWANQIVELVDTLSKYDFVIHAAANTNVEQCEIDVAGCYRDNWLLTEKLAQATTLAGVKLVFVSSTGIYGDGKTEPYAEYDPVRPTTHHHNSKQLAEQAVLRFSKLNLILRTGWMFGGDWGLMKNFVARRIEEAIAATATGRVLSSNKDQYGVPCYNADVAQRLLVLAKSDSCGVFNCVNSGHASRYEYVSAIVEFYGLDVEVKPANALGFNRRARVSNNEMAKNWRMECLGFPPMPDWRESLKNYIAILKSQRET